MTSRGELCIVTVDQQTGRCPREPLADVLVVGAGPLPPTEVFKRVFAHNPGLTLALVMRDEAAAHACFRSSLPFAVPLASPSGGSLHDLAVALYDGWVSGGWRPQSGS